MALFLGNLTFLFEIVVVAAGLILLHFAKKEKGALLKGAGYLLLIGGLLIALCTGYHHMKYHFKGEFNSAYSSFKHKMSGKWKRGDKIWRGDKKKKGHFRKAGQPGERLKKSEEQPGRKID